MVKYYSYSLLNKRCHRAIYLYGTTPETLPPAAQVVGIELHKAFKDRDWDKIGEMGFNYNPIKELIRRTPPQNLWQEEWFKVELTEEVGIKGKIDLIWKEKGEINICDIKSAYKYDKRVRGQLETYALASLFGPEDTVNLYVYLAKSDKICLVSTVRVGEYASLIGKALERIWEIEEIQDMRETPRGRGSDECVWCDYSISCLACPTGVKINPVDMARDYLCNKARGSHIERILKAYCEQRDIKVGDSIIGYHSGKFGIRKEV